jgi:GTP cyclohydrolase I
MTPNSAEASLSSKTVLGVTPSVETPLLQTAFERSDAEKIALITEHFEQIMDILGLDREDDSLKGTPKRIAKMYVNDLFSGLDVRKMPSLTTFENRYQYGQMLVEKNIRFFSSCEHHFMPIIGTAHVGYISSGKVIGLSKINRLVKFLARRPQVQERHTLQIMQALQDALGTEDVAVIMEAQHTCVMTRGVGDEHTSTVTMEFAGQFQDPQTQERFMQFIRQPLMR